MKVIISPAKKLDFKNKVSTSDYSEIQFPQEACELIPILKKCSSKDLRELMGISPALAQLNMERFNNWKYPFEKELQKQAIFAFKGTVYDSMKATDFNSKELQFCQDNIRILSGLYGLLKPLDMILAYRLEMGIKLRTKKGKNLYEFWNNKITNRLKEDLINGEPLINLASNEYSRVINIKTFTNIITPVFKDYKNGKLKVISFFAKKARGSMCNFIVKNKITDPNNLKLFANLDYVYTEDSGKGELVFTR